VNGERSIDIGPARSQPDAAFHGGSSFPTLPCSEQHNGAYTSWHFVTPV